MKLDDLAFSARFKEVLNRMVKTILAEERPPYRYAYMVGLDLETGRATVIYPGEYEPISLPCAGTPPPIGSLAKIDGVGGGRHVVGAATFFTPAMGRTDKCGSGSGDEIILPEGTAIPGGGSSVIPFMLAARMIGFIGFTNEVSLTLQGGMKVIHEAGPEYLVGQIQTISSFVIPYSGIYNVLYNLIPKRDIENRAKYPSAFYVQITSEDGTVEFAVPSLKQEANLGYQRDEAYVGLDAALPLKTGDKVCMVFMPSGGGSYGWAQGQFSLKWVGFNPFDTTISGDFITNLKLSEAGEDIPSP